MKFNSLVPEDLQFIQEKLQSETYYEEHIITHIDNPTGRIKFKDTRKVSIGISKKDILSYRCKKKSAFYNCFVLILRMKVEHNFKEFHVKVFNTGKLEIPGVQCEKVFEKILQQVLDTLQPYVETPLGYKDDSSETVLINSNFNCGYYINRETLYDILKLKYNIQAIYDPCSYPGIQCKFYYNPDIGIQSGSQISEENKHLYKNIKEVSFMIFRTGSVLIVGKCHEDVLMIIYNFLKNILRDEYRNICQKNIKINNEIKDSDKKKKVHRKNILIDIQSV
jgi:TATA-box binding protein (TBP) (component of TFIID and TFIIIB)